MTMGIAEVFAGRGTARLEHSLRLALEGGTDDAVARAYGALAFAATGGGSGRTADRWLEEGIRYTEERDLDCRPLYLLGWRAAAALDRWPLGRGGGRREAVLRHPYARLSRVWALMALGACARGGATRKSGRRSTRRSS